MKKLCLPLFGITIIISACSPTGKPVIGVGKEVNPYHYTSTKTVTVRNGCVASAHPLASETGLAILKRGGNAFDAAIATQLTLAVVYPGAGNLGGGGFLLGRKVNGELVGIDYREAAPEKASRDMYLDKNGNPQLALSQSGHLASGIPGTVAGLFATMPYAKLPFKQLIQPAIDLAEKGFVISEREAASLNSTHEAFLKHSTRPTALVKEAKWKA